MGLLLYLFTLVLELLSVAARFGIVYGLAALALGPRAGLALGATAALAPLASSLLILAGAPSGHLLVRRSLRARALREAERVRLRIALARPLSLGVPMPRQIYAVDRDGLNAAVSGRTLFVYRDLFDSPHLAAVLAHELGHYNSSDGRLLLAIRSLTIPGGFLVANLLLSALSWLAYLSSLLLLGLAVLVFLVLRVSITRAAGAIFLGSVTLLRLLIIFAVGGVGTALLGSVWRSYFHERELEADAYAGRLGYANDLIAFFETEILSDVDIPWDSQPSHPPTRRRVAALEAIAAAYPQAAPLPPGLARRRPAGHRAGPGAGAADGPGVGRRSGARLSPPLLLAAAAAITLALAAALALGWTGSGGPPAPRPTAGPTPTLGLPGGP